MTPIESSLPGLVVWLVALALLGSAGGRLLHSGFPDHGGVAELGRSFGCLLFAYACWILPSLGMAPFSFTTTLGVAAAIFAASRCVPRGAPRDVSGSAVFYGSFLFFVVIRAWTPEIFWGEKPMDFSFLNVLYRTTSLPPPEPWMAGHPLNYPYFGHLAIAALGKLTRVDPALAFNLGIATTGALTAAAAFGAGVAIAGHRDVGIAAAVLITFAGNLSGPGALLAHEGIVHHAYFWATSRVIEGTINEFPLWSFLFADLHAHVLALPFSLLLLGLAVHAVWVVPLRVTSFLCVSLALGAVAVTSTWSLPVYAGALGGLALVTALRERRVGSVALAALTIGLSYVWFLPYWTRFVAPPRVWGWETAAAPLSGVLLIFGAFLFVLLLALDDFERSRWDRHSLRVEFGIAVALAAAHSSRMLFVLLGLACLLAAVLERERSRSVAFTFGAGATMLGAIADTVFFWDRMNTVFKSYLQMWLLLGLACAVWLFVRPRGWSRGRLTALTALALVSAFTAATDVVATLRTRYVPSPRPTLDGQAYLALHRPGDAGAIEWLEENVPGTPVVLEAQGARYREFARISAHTGLPTVLGWEYHLLQRAHPWPEIEERKAAVRRIYEENDRELVRELLRRYDVALVYVGDLERREYGEAGLAKFEEWKDLFRLLFRNTAVRIYGVIPASPP